MRAKGILTYVKEMDGKNQITLLPFLFREALMKSKKDITDEMIVTLGEANAYGWIAYTIYDDFLDGEGKSELLPIANIALRSLTQIYAEFSLRFVEFKKVFDKLMNRLEAANVWEAAHCKSKKEIPEFKNLRILADKSIGIALAPAAILCSLGFSSKSQELQKTLSFFEHFLIAKQLNDDAHDWEKDLKEGQLTPVVVLLMKKTLAFPKRSLQEVFWYDVILQICKIIDDNVNEARVELKKTNFTNLKTLEDLLNPLSHATQKALEERKRTIEFLSSYKPPHI